MLYVEDAAVIRDTIARLLKISGYEVAYAKNGEEGIEKAIEIKPDCILMDVVMPGKNGFQATRDLSRNPATSTIPVIIITTKDQETDKIWGMRQGAVEYLVKPVAEKELIAKIDSVMAD